MSAWRACEYERNEPDWAGEVWMVEPRKWAVRVSMGGCVRYGNAPSVAKAKRLANDVARQMRADRREP